MTRIASAGFLFAYLALTPSVYAQSHELSQALPSSQVEPKPTSQAAGVARPDRPVRPIPGQLHNAQAISAFLEKLPSARDRSLTILQIGDSHTAGDMITNGWRTAWQGEFGPGGRGALAVGRPYRGYLTWGVTANQSPGWSTNALLGRQYSGPAGPALGLSGFTQTAVHADATVSLSADSPPFMFDHFSLCGLTGPDKGAVNIVMGAETATFAFRAEESGANCFDLSSPTLVSSVTVKTVDNRPVSLTSWETRRQSGGLLLSNLGVVGSRFLHFERADDEVLGRELRHMHPDLLVIAFGTNEAFAPDLSQEKAEAVIREQIGRIRRLLGYEVPILLIGPPDVETRRSDIALPDRPETVACDSNLYVPGNVALIKRVQRRLASEMNLAYWDWQSAMGGPCSSERWVAQGLQRADHIHFTAAGGRLIGEAIARDLDKARADMTGG